MGRIGARPSTDAALECPGDDGYVYLFDGTDSDGDGQRNCADPDDDNDGIPDAKDWCPSRGFHSAMRCGSALRSS